MSRNAFAASSHDGTPTRPEHSLEFVISRAPVPSVIDHLMAAGALLPEQLPSASIAWSPEKKLAAAVLTSALADIRTHHGNCSARRRVAETLEWVRSDDTEWPFSFLRLCMLFGLDPEWVRAEVRQWIAAPRDERELKRIVFRRAA